MSLPDGKTVAEGTLDEIGFAHVDGIDPGTFKITFPNLDKDAGRRHEDWVRTFFGKCRLREFQKKVVA